MSDPQVRKNIWGDIKGFAKGTWEFARDNLFGTSAELKTMNWNPLKWKAWNYVGGMRSNGPANDANGQRGLSPSQIGPSAGGPNSMNRGDDGGLWHDRLFAWTKGRAFGGIYRAAGDVGLVVNCAYAIIPGSRMAPIIPTALTAAGIAVAAPFHATHLDQIIPGM